MRATLAVLVVCGCVAGTAHAAGEPPVVTAIRHEFGVGPLAGCFAGIANRESRYNRFAANYTDANGGSYGALQINAVWRDRGESVAAFARRMYDPQANAALAHRIYRLYGLAPWGGSCG